MGNDTCKFCPTCDPNLKECNGEDSIYGIDERGIRYMNNKIDDMTKAKRYNEWFAENNKHQSYGSTLTPYLGDYTIALGEISDLNQENPILGIQLYFLNSSQVLDEWILDSFDVESSSSGISNDLYSRDLEEYKSVFDNKIAQLANEYELRIRKKGYIMDDIWEKCEQVYEVTIYSWYDQGFEEEE
ncbi:hypothetical protein Tco_1008715 [Tanacetum coccineum]